MNGPNHRETTKFALEFLAEKYNDYYFANKCIANKDADGVRFYDETDMICKKNSDTDKFNQDLEFIDVEGWANTGRDNPHKHEKGAINDVARYSTQELTERIADVNYKFTSFLHFIDIGSENHLFDDYDGYSFRYGTGHVNEVEPGFSSNSGFLSWLEDTFDGAIFSKKRTLDADINYYFNDEYVHAPGQEYYANCSPAVWRYTFDTDDKYDEILRRYPLAEHMGKMGKGIPYSVFSPVDNLGRFWYERFLLTNKCEDIGPTLHAIQDASVPHHAGGHMGNYHRLYENIIEDMLSVVYDAYRSKKAWDIINFWVLPGYTVNDFLYGDEEKKSNATSRPELSWQLESAIEEAKKWQDLLNDGTSEECDEQYHLTEFHDDVMAYFDLWSKEESTVTELKYPEDMNKTPSKKWRIDHLITWLAFYAYDAYKNTFEEFQKPYKIESMDIIVDEAYAMLEAFEKNMFDIFQKERDDKTKLSLLREPYRTKAFQLLKMAVAMSMLVMEKAKEEQQEVSNIPTERKVLEISFSIGSSSIAKCYELYRGTKQVANANPLFNEIGLNSRLVKPFVLRIRNHYCGGSVDFDLDDYITKINSNSIAGVINVEDMNIDSDIFELELESISTHADIGNYSITYKTKDQKVHYYAGSSGGTNKIVFPKNRNCVDIPRMVNVAKKYYINRKSQKTGEHEIHKEGCSYLRRANNMLALGEYENAQDALIAGQSLYKKVDGCYLCCLEINKD